MRPLILSLKPFTYLVLATPLALAACGEGTDPAPTGAVEADPPVVVDPVDPVVVDPAVPPAADDTTIR